MDSLLGYTGGYQGRHDWEPIERPEYLVHFDGTGIWKIRYQMLGGRMHILSLDEQLAPWPMPCSVTFYNRRSLRREAITGRIL